MDNATDALQRLLAGCLPADKAAEAMGLAESAAKAAYDAGYENGRESGWSDGYDEGYVAGAEESDCWRIREND